MEDNKNGDRRRKNQGRTKATPSGTKKKTEPARQRGAASARQRAAYQTNGQAGGPKNAAGAMTKRQLAKKRRNKILLFVAEFFVLLILIIVFWGMTKSQDIQYVQINEDEVEIDDKVQTAEESGAMKGFMNVALFAVDSTESKLEGNTRTDTMMIASINMDTKEIRLVSLYRDTYLNLSTDVYNKANSAYAKGGAKQAMSMMNMNLDMNIKNFVTVGFQGLIDVIDAVGGIEIDVTEEEIVHLNNYQISIVGEPTGTLNAMGEPNYYAEPYVEYTPVTEAGLQKLNGLQATAYCRIRYVGNDFARTSRQRTVLEKVAKKAITLNPAKLNSIAEAVFPEISTNFKLADIISLLSSAAEYEFVESSGFPFDGMYKSGRIGQKGSCIVPTTLADNVVKLHEFLFQEVWEPSETVKACSEKIKSDTLQYISY